MKHADNGLTNSETDQEVVPLNENVFPRTRWTLVQTASDEEGPVAQRALEDLCEMYWKPVFAYIKRRGCKTEEAEDLTQGFFQMVLTRKMFGKAEKERGRLRSFLLKSAQGAFRRCV